MFCQVAIHLPIFERQLDEEQLARYMNYSAMKQLDPDEKLAYCPHCKYFEIWPVQMHGMGFFYCRNPGCTKVSCVHCHVEVIVPEDGRLRFSVLNEARTPSSRKEMHHHFACAELAPHKEAFDQAIRKGAGSTCPNPDCGLSGIKDDACTHMTCLHCQTQYCYVCELSVDNCDKDDPNGNIYSHNVNWRANPKRCPMFLLEIPEVDRRWGPRDGSATDTQMVAFLSKVKTLALLRQVVLDMGEETYNKLKATFPSVANCGFTDYEILNADLTIIKRR